MDRTQLILNLMDTPKVGERTIATILRRMSVLRMDPGALLSMSAVSIADEFKLKPELAHAVERSVKSASERNAALSKQLTSAGVSLVSMVDAAYPQRLVERMAHPPAILFVYGNAALLERSLIAIANSNGARETALTLGDRAVEAAAAEGWALVTGHNRIEYQRPALAAKRNGMGICYVLDRGIIEGFGGDLTRDLFPAARIWGPAYDPLTDLTISTFGPLDHGNLAGNRKRDSLVFALADTIIAASIMPGGNMEKQCLDALGRNAEVWLGPDPICVSTALEETGAKRLAETEDNNFRAAIHRGSRK